MNIGKTVEFNREKLFWIIFSAHIAALTLVYLAFQPPLIGIDVAINTVKFDLIDKAVDLIAHDPLYQLLLYFSSKLSYTHEFIAVVKILAFSLLSTCLFKSIFEKKQTSKIKYIYLFYLFSYYLLTSLVFIHKSSFFALLVFGNTFLTVKHFKYSWFYFGVSSALLLSTRIDSIILIFFNLLIFRRLHLNNLEVIKTISLITGVVITINFSIESLSSKSYRADNYKLLPVLNIPVKAFRSDPNLLNQEDIEFLKNYMTKSKTVEDYLSTNINSTNFSISDIKRKLTYEEILDFYKFSITILIKAPLVFLEAQIWQFWKSTFHLYPSFNFVMDVFTLNKSSNFIPSEEQAYFKKIGVNHKNARSEFEEKLLLSKSSFLTNWFRYVIQVLFSPFIFLLACILYIFKSKDNRPLPFVIYAFSIMLIAPKTSPLYYSFTIYVPFILLYCLSFPTRLANEMIDRT